MKLEDPRSYEMNLNERHGIYLSVYDLRFCIIKLQKPPVSFRLPHKRRKHLKKLYQVV